VTYQDASVIDFISSNLVPWRVDYLNKKDIVKHYRVEWTPSVFVLDENAEEHHRILGFLSPDQFLGQLRLGLARIAYHRGEIAKAAELFEITVSNHPATVAAPEAIWYRGISKYQASGDPSVLKSTRLELEQRYPHSIWGEKASAWGK
jgi:hypothetical protein